MNYPYVSMNAHSNICSYDNYAPMHKMPMQVSCVEPCLVSALMSLAGKKLVVETVRGSLQGKLMDVKPDYIVIGEPCGHSKFYIRIAEIVHIMPID